MLKFIKNLDYLPIEIMSIKRDVDALSVEVLKNLMTIGGCCSAVIEKEKIDAIINHPGVSEKDKVNYRKLTADTPMIIIIEEVFDNLTDDEVMAIFLHEQCHIVNGDTANPTKTFNIDGGYPINVVCNTDIELRADAYAAERIGKEVMKSALINVITANYKLLGSIYPEVDAEMIIQSVLESEEIKTRIAALS